MRRMNVEGPQRVLGQRRKRSGAHRATQRVDVRIVRTLLEVVEQKGARLLMRRVNLKRASQARLEVGAEILDLLGLSLQMYLHERRDVALGDVLMIVQRDQIGNVAGRDVGLDRQRGGSPDCIELIMRR